MRQILKPGKSYSFSEYFDLPFAIDDILAELGCGIDRKVLELPRKSMNGSLELLQREIQRNSKRIELSNKMARREALILHNKANPFISIAMTLERDRRSI